MSEMAPLVRREVAQMPAVAAGSDGKVVLRAPFAGTVTSVAYVPTADITGADTNSRTLAATNKGSDGTGTTQIASLALTNGNDMSDYDENAVTLSGTAANLSVDEGDVIAFTSTHVGTGLADPGGLVIVTISRD